MRPAVTGATAEDTMSRITVVGEALVDVVTDASGSREHPGGSPLNVAVGLARLGHETTLVTRLGADCRGQLITDHLTAAGVRIGDGAVDDAATSVATATLDQRGRADYEVRAPPARPVDRLVATGGPPAHGIYRRVPPTWRGRRHTSGAPAQKYGDGEL